MFQFCSSRLVDTWLKCRFTGALICLEASSFSFPEWDSGGVEWSGVKAPAAGCWQLLSSESALNAMPSNCKVCPSHAGPQLTYASIHIGFAMPTAWPAHLFPMQFNHSCLCSITCIVGHESPMHHQNVGMEGGHSQVLWFLKNQFLHSIMLPTFKMLIVLRMCSVSHTWIVSGYVGHHPATFLLLLIGW